MQAPALETAKALGLSAIAVDGNIDAPFAHLAARFFHIDLKDKEALLDLATRLKNEDEGLAAVFTAGTDFSYAVAFIAEKLRLPGNSYQTALNTTDKARMRSCFDAAGVPSPRYVRVTAAAAQSPPAMPFDFPAVVKPVDNMGARGCRRVDGEAELKDALEDALKFSRSGAAIVEEYMDGAEFSIDSVVYQNSIYITGFADRHIFFPPYFIEMGHTIPSSLDAEKTAAVLDVFKKGIYALGINSGCAKGDVKLTSRGPMIGEIASRLSGGYMSGWTYPYSSGAELTKAAMLAALGATKSEVEAALAVRHNSTSAERAFISIPGTIRKIYGAEECKKIEYIKDIFLRVKAGDKVEFPVNNVTKCGNVISAAPSREAAVRAAESAAAGIYLELEYPNQQTQDFLDGAKDGAVFPPAAFALSAGLLRECNALASSSIIGRIQPENTVLTPFPALLDSGLRDRQGRTAAEALTAVREISGLPLPFLASEGITANVLGRGFWSAFARGGYQGAAYYIQKVTSEFKG
jgi:biotin carboxylase